VCAENEMLNVEVVASGVVESVLRVFERISNERVLLEGVYFINNLLVFSINSQRMQIAAMNPLPTLVRCLDSPTVELVFTALQ
jgi:hypothetical protein